MPTPPENVSMASGRRRRDATDETRTPTLPPVRGDAIDATHSISHRRKPRSSRKRVGSLKKEKERREKRKKLEPSSRPRPPRRRIARSAKPN